MLSLKVSDVNIPSSFYPYNLDEIYEITNKYRKYRDGDDHYMNISFSFDEADIEDDYSRALAPLELSDMRFEVIGEEKEISILIEKLNNCRISNTHCKVSIDGPPIKKLIKNNEILKIIKSQFSKSSIDDESIYNEFTLTDKKRKIYFGYEITIPKIETNNIKVEFNIDKKEYDNRENGKTFLSKFEQILDTVVQKYTSENMKDNFVMTQKIE
jgi:hypothetical protein